MAESAESHAIQTGEGRNKVISRGFVRIEGPPAAGKTTLIERVLRGNRSTLLAAARIDKAPVGKPSREIRDEDSHITRFIEAGACDASSFQIDYQGKDSPEDFFWCSDLMSDYFHGLLIENPGPLDLQGNHTVFVLRPLEDGEEFIERGTLRVPRHVLKASFGAILPGLGGGSEHLDNAFRRTFDKLDEKGLDIGEHWCLRDPYAGMTRADTILINTNDDENSDRLERTVAEIKRMAEEPELAQDIFMWRAGSRNFHINTGDLRARKQPDINKAINRIRSVLRQASDYEPES